MGTAIFWFRRDLRLADNPALTEAAKSHEGMIPLYVHDPQQRGPSAPGAACRWWLHHSMGALARDLQRRGTGLIIRTGPAATQIAALCDALAVRAVYCNWRFEPDAQEELRQVERELARRSVALRAFNGSYLFHPNAVLNGRGQPYRVFTPFWRQCKRHLETMVAPAAAPRRLPPLPEGVSPSANPALGLLPTAAWDSGLKKIWTAGERAAAQRLNDFCRHTLQQYAGARDNPALEATSRLSPHLHFGEISPRQIAWTVRNTAAASGAVDTPSVETFLKELVWREFACHILYHFPATVSQPMEDRFRRFPWRKQSKRMLGAWQRGHTGIPLVDAGMRQLWHTGWMHNRVRMVVASFLTKNLRIHWRHGAEWFRDTLVDADLASNTLNWQWVAGCGADAAPYFRVFNPVSQGRKFDPEGVYVRRWVPELEAVPTRYVHEPWAMSEPDRRLCALRLGGDYPKPLVDLSASRQEAIDLYRNHVATRRQGPRR